MLRLRASGSWVIAAGVSRDAGVEEKRMLGASLRESSVESEEAESQTAGLLRHTARILAG